MFCWVLDVPVPVWRHIATFLYLREVGQMSTYAPSMLSININVDKYTGPLHCTNLAQGLQLFKYFKRRKKQMKISHVQLNPGRHELPIVNTVFLSSNPAHKLIIEEDVVVIGSHNATTLVGGLDVRGGATITLNNLTITNPHMNGIVVGAQCTVTTNNVTVQQCKKSGIKIENGGQHSKQQTRLIAKHCKFQHNGENGLFINGGECTLINCSVTGNAANGIAVRSQATCTLVPGNTGDGQSFVLEGNKKASLSVWGVGSVVRVQIKKGVVGERLMLAINNNKDVQRGGEISVV